MGFKSLLLIVFILFFAIFSFQNRGAIALTFFGFNSPTLPLFLWVLLALLAGIISSLLINLFSNNLVENNQRNQSFYPPYSPPPPTQPKKEKYPPLEKSDLPQENIREKLSYRWEEDEIFEDLPDNSPQTIPQTNSSVTDKTYIPAKIESTTSPPESSEISLTSNQATEKPETREERENQAETKEEENSNINVAVQSAETEDDSPFYGFSRQASPYSYQTREKTDIRPKTSKSRAKQPPVSPPKRVYQGVYDAPYRVIAPAQDDSDYNSDYKGDRRDDFIEDEEDWDF